MAGDGPDIIDLGDVRWSESWTRPRHVLPPRGRRSLAVVTVVVAVFTILASSIPLNTPRLDRPLWTMAGRSSFSIGAANVYLRSSDGTGLLAIAPDTGRVRWRVPGENLDLWSEVGGELVFLVGTSVTAPRLVAFNTDPSGVPRTGPPTTRLASSLVDGPETVIAELATGRVLARHLGYPLGLAEGGAAALVMDWQVEGCSLGFGRACAFVVAVNLHTAGELWRLPVPTDLSWNDADPQQRVLRRLLIGVEDGSAVLHDAVSGDALSSVQVRSHEAARTSASLVRDALFLAYEDGAGVHVAKVRLDTGERLWTTTTTTRPSDPAPLRPSFEVVAEGDLLVLTHDGVSTSLDPLTGRIRMQVTADGLRDLGGGRLAVRSLDSGDPARIVDAATGTTLGSYPGADVAGDGRGHVLVIRQADTWATVTVLDAAGREMTWGAVRGDGILCQAGLGFFGCTDRSGQLRIWRVPA